MTDQPLKTLCSKCGKDADGGSTGGVPICWDCYYNNLNKKHNKLWCAACGTWGDHQSGTCPTITHNSSLKTQNHPHMPNQIITDNSKVTYNLIQEVERLKKENDSKDMIIQDLKNIFPEVVDYLNRTRRL